MESNNVVFLSAPYSAIEPLGLLHLADIAKQEEWTPQIFLVKDNNFSKLEREIEKRRPSMIGFTIYTGNHRETFKFADYLKQKKRSPQIIFGGPHATYFSNESSKHSDYVVLSQGFNGFRRILSGESSKGIVSLEKIEEFPASERIQFYKDHPFHKKSSIKSVITQTGCPYRCSYCYNSSRLEDLDIPISPQDFKNMKSTLGVTGRLFPRIQRPVNNVIEEVSNILEISPETNRIYFQDDVFGVDLKWLKQFSREYKKLGVPFHAQMRFEYLDPKKDGGKERLDHLVRAGCDGLTFAIESAIPEIRDEVLNRKMPQDLMFNVFQKLSEKEFKVRTEQMVGLPYGATKTPTPTGINADLKTLELNVQLKKATGLPTMAWSSIFTPYIGTNLGQYCLNHGHYSGTNDDIPPSFFEKSVLNFTNKWVGTSLSKKTPDVWMEGKEKEEHYEKLNILKNLFTTFALIPQGHLLAKDFMDGESKSLGELSKKTRRHLYSKALYTLEE
jgi:radical SAM superfamily enzyme YgiQ (UPF0313 family)